MSSLKCTNKWTIFGNEYILPLDKLSFPQHISVLIKGNLNEIDIYIDLGINIL